MPSIDINGQCLIHIDTIWRYMLLKTIKLHTLE